MAHQDPGSVRSTGDSGTKQISPSSEELQNLTCETLLLLYTDGCGLMDEQWI